MEEMAFVEAAREGRDDPTPSQLYADFLQETLGLSRRDALLRTVLQAPRAVGPRLAYADCLEAEGEPERAAFVRQPFSPSAGSGPRSKAYRSCLNAIRPTLPSRRVPILLCDERLQSGWSLPALLAEQLWYVSEEDVFVVVRHGFIAEVGCGQAWFLRVAGELFRRHPVRDVRLSDAVPGGSESRLCWHEGPEELHGRVGGSLLARPLFCNLRAFGTGVGRCYGIAVQAWADLSWACVEYGRWQAGLAHHWHPLRP